MLAIKCESSCTTTEKYYYHWMVDLKQVSIINVVIIYKKY